MSRSATPSDPVGQGRLARLAHSSESFALLTQPSFDEMAARHSLNAMRFGAAGMTFVLAVLVLVVGVMAPRLIREGRLLLFGEAATATVTASTATYTGTSKSGVPLHRLEVDYTFLVGGQSVNGSALRTDVQSPEPFKTGERIAVLYEARDPTNSTIAFNHATDVVALALFLPFMVLVPGTFGLLWLHRYRRWRRQNT